MINKYKLLITGRNVLDKLIKDNIYLYDIDNYKDKVIVIVDEVGYKKIKKKYKYKILNRYGKNKLNYLFNKYFIFICAFILGIIINIFLSNIIFSIDIIHSNKKIRNIIKEDLNKYGIRRFYLKKSYKNKEKIIEKILKKENNNIEWLEIEEVGTKYIVRVEQRKKKIKDKKCPLQNIIAKKSAMILDIDAYSGEVVKKRLDYVSKGDVIISGLIHNKEKIVKKKCALGKVYGEVWYNVEVELPIKYKLNTINKKAIKIADNKMKGKYIISKKVLKKYQKNSKIIVDIFYKVKEDITDTESINNIDINIENNKNSKE
ncbi:MAG: sporulation protein YqfD [Bacilli bacterium]|nr:sporulation protein YqfD [Bacilli bacterium]